MLKITLSAHAKADFKTIAKYTHEVWGIEQRHSYMRAVDSAFLSLADNPSLGRPCSGLRQGMYRYAVKRHVVFYRVRTNGLVILRILHERQSPERAFR
jgi:toxin ParE1/3/4